MLGGGSHWGGRCSKSMPGGPGSCCYSSILRGHQYYETEISTSVRNEFQCKTNIFHGFTVLTKLAELLIISFPHFCYRRPPGTLVRKTTHVNKSRNRGAPMAT